MLQSDSEPMLYDIPDIERILGVSRPTVNRMFARGDLKKVKIGRAVRVRASDLNAYLESMTDDGTPIRPDSKNSRPVAS